MRPNAWGVALMAAVALAGCGGGDTGDRLNVADPQVRFINAVRTADTISLYREEVRQADATAVGYKFASRYFDVSESSANWSVRPTNAAIHLRDISFKPERGDRNTLIALNDGNTQLVVVKDPYRKSLYSTDARVRVFGAASNALALDLYLTPANTSLLGIAPSFANLQFKQAVPIGGDDSVYYGAGTYRLRATLAGTKTTVFSALLTLVNNADVLLVALPATDSGSVPSNAVKFLVVQGNNSATVSSELLPES